MSEKTIKEVVGEFKEIFGRVEFMAENMQTGQKGVSKGWQEKVAPRLELDADRYLSLATCNINTAVDAKAYAGLSKIVIGKK